MTVPVLVPLPLSVLPVWLLSSVANTSPISSPITLLEGGSVGGGVTRAAAILSCL